MRIFWSQYSVVTMICALVVSRQMSSAQEIVAIKMIILFTNSVYLRIDQILSTPDSGDSQESQLRRG